MARAALVVELGLAAAVACKAQCEGAGGAYGDGWVTCDGETQSREYAVTVEAAAVVVCTKGVNDAECQNSGAATGNEPSCSCDCGAVAFEGAHCETATPNAPVNCEGEWGVYGDCSVTCGGGTQSRDYVVRVEAAYDGTACPAELQESQDCNTQVCPTCGDADGAGDSEDKFDCSGQAQAYGADVDALLPPSIATCCTGPSNPTCRDVDGPATLARGRYDCSDEVNAYGGASVGPDPPGTVRRPNRFPP
jgi:hypothetical protein